MTQSLIPNVVTKLGFYLELAKYRHESTKKTYYNGNWA